MEFRTKIIDCTVGDVEKKLNEAAEIIKCGGLVVFPTETVYGIGADATSSNAAKKIYEAKGRPSDNPLIIHVAKPEDVESYAETTPLYYRLANAFMPGPITVVLPAKKTIPRTTTGGLDTVAVRCPSHPIAHKLIELSEVPIAAPSANLSGSPSPTSASHVIDDMQGRVDMIIDGGECDIGLESTIVKIEDGERLTLLRPGKITPEQLLTVVDSLEISSAVTDKLKDGERVQSPGMKYRHYAPKSALTLISGSADALVDYIRNKNHSSLGIICYLEDKELLQNSFPLADIYVIGEKSDELSQAHKLFAILRLCDKKTYDMIYAPVPSSNGLGLALYNRMIRAAAYQIINL